MLGDWLSAGLIYAMVIVTTAAMLWLPWPGSSPRRSIGWHLAELGFTALCRSASSLGARLPGRRHQSYDARSSARAIELIVQDARRLGPRIASPQRGVSFAKFEGWRCAYDRVLGEACRAVEVEHLLGVLPPGPLLDAERARVENALWLAGLRLDEAA